MLTRGVLEWYFTHLLDGYPTFVIAIVVAYTLAALAWGLLKDWRQAWRLLAIGYGILILYVTVFSRPTCQASGYSLQPFASYLLIIGNRDGYLLLQVIMNVVAFLPVGFLARAAFVHWSWGKSMACGVLLSVVIETLQLVLLKGTAELDDVIHNTLGCLIGIGIYELLCSFRRMAKQYL